MIVPIVFVCFDLKEYLLGDTRLTDIIRQKNIGGAYPKNQKKTSRYTKIGKLALASLIFRILSQKSKKQQKKPKKTKNQLLHQNW